LRETVRLSSKPFTWEVAIDNEPSRDLKNEDRSTGTESRTHETLSDLNMEVFSARSELIVHALVRDLSREDLPTRPDSSRNEALRTSEAPFA